ncbi:sugar ABC transporter substrate-binding protein [Paenibacillus turpanensis]|uniref:sugar ABC transporter substrate-binding protein n=1 Tax=Paenibacillus turpanensis TaxID=2689078 RepID=UPI00140C2B5F|nr:substrate-binding domain-containing protein [Paenibacillus turpanensis]
MKPEMNRSQSKLTGLFTAALALLMLSGCWSAAGESAPLPNKEPLEEQSPAYTFGIIYPMAHPFYEMITSLAEQAAGPLSVRLLVKAPDEISLEQQIRMMETMIKQKVDGIAIAPIDPVALRPVIDRAAKAGIPVVCFEADSPGSLRKAFIGTDDEAAGARMGEVVDRLLKGRGMILVQAGLEESPAHRSRLEGMLEYLVENTDIQVLDVRRNNGSGEHALADLEQMIDEHPHFDALVTLDVVSSSAAILVWKAMGLNRDAAAFGMMPDSKEAIRNGQFTAVLSRNEQNWGRWIIESLLLLAEGKPAPAFTETYTHVVTKDNVDLFSRIGE